MSCRGEQPSRWLALSAIAALAALTMADGALAAKADKAAKAPARKEKKNAAAGERVVRGGAWERQSPDWRGGAWERRSPDRRGYKARHQQSAPPAHFA